MKASVVPRMSSYSLRSAWKPAPAVQCCLTETDKVQLCELKYHLLLCKN